MARRFRGDSLHELMRSVSQFRWAVCVFGSSVGSQLEQMIELQGIEREYLSNKQSPPNVWCALERRKGIWGYIRLGANPAFYQTLPPGIEVSRWIGKKEIPFPPEYLWEAHVRAVEFGASTEQLRSIEWLLNFRENEEISSNQLSELVFGRFESWIRSLENDDATGLTQLILFTQGLAAFKSDFEAGRLSFSPSACFFALHFLVEADSGALLNVWSKAASAAPDPWIRLLTPQSALAVLLEVAHSTGEAEEVVLRAARQRHALADEHVEAAWNAPTSFAFANHLNWAMTWLETAAYLTRMSTDIKTKFRDEFMKEAIVIEEKLVRARESPWRAAFTALGVMSGFDEDVIMAMLTKARNEDLAGAERIGRDAVINRWLGSFGDLDRWLKTIVEIVRSERVDVVEG